MESERVHCRSFLLHEHSIVPSNRDGFEHRAAILSKFDEFIGARRLVPD
jgi:hypothetical protein